MKKLSMTSDTIQHLPTDQIPPTQEEKDMISWLFSEPKDQLRSPSITKIGMEFRTVVWIGILFFLFTLSPVDSVLSQFVPFTRHNTIYLSLVKTFLFILISWVIINISYLWKKKGAQ